MITYTKEEEKALVAIEEKYRPELEAAMAEMNKYDISKQPDEYLAAANRFHEINEKIQAEQEVYFRRAELRAFDSFNGDVDRMVRAFKNQILTFIYISKIFVGDAPSPEERAERQKRIEEEKENLKKAIEHNEALLKQYPDDEELRKNTEELKNTDPEKASQFLYDMIYSEKALHERIKDSFAIYFEFLSKVDPKAYDELQIFIDKAIKARDNIKPSDLNAKELNESELISKTIMTRYPEVYITPKDKVSNLLFEGNLSEELEALRTESLKSKKKLTAVARIDYDELNGVEIKGRRKINAYDREVHDAIVTLYVDGGNEYITPQMIYQVMTGNPDAYLEKKQAEAISDSITKCMFSKLTIDASKEAEAYGFDSFKYEGSLISGERVTASLNGTVVECLRILRTPALYEYANKKNQIGRFDIKLLNSPINKTEEVITLQGYLYRRILSMKGNPNLSKNIVYDTVYSQIEVKAASDGALRKKKAKVRDHVKKILDYWTKENFIAGYRENKRGRVVHSVTIRL